MEVKWQAKIVVVNVCAVYMGEAQINLILVYLNSLP